MADRYWVGGTGTWNSSNTANWSATSGGASGASVPTSADNVFFDDNSSAGNFTVTISGAVNCSNFEGLSSVTKVLTIAGDTSSSINFYGTGFSTTSNSGSSFSSFNGFVNIYGNVGALSGNVQVKNVRVKTDAVGRLVYSVNTVTEVLEIEARGSVQVYNSYTCNVLRAGTVAAIFTRAGIILGRAANQNVLLIVKSEISGAFESISLYPSTSYLVANPSGSSMSLNLGERFGTSVANAIIHKLLLQPNTGTNVFRFDIYFLITTLTNSSSPCVLEFSPSAFEMTFGTFDINGTVSTKTKIQSTVSGVRAKITGPSSAVTNYVEVKDMQPSPDNSWISYNSTNAGNNFQWYFDNFNKPTSNLFFGSHV